MLDGFFYLAAGAAPTPPASSVLQYSIMYFVVLSAYLPFAVRRLLRHHPLKFTAYTTTHNTHTVFVCGGDGRKFARPFPHHQNCDLSEFGVFVCVSKRVLVRSDAVFLRLLILVYGIARKRLQLFGRLT